MVDLNLKLLENGGTNLRDNVTFEFIFLLVLFFIQQYLSECVGRHQAALLINVVQEKFD